MMDEVSEVRFLEVGDLSAAPDGMWGGLESLGYGTALESVDSNHAIALMQHFYFNDVLGNVAHALFGAGPERIRVERQDCKTHRRTPRAYAYRQRCQY